MLKYNEANPLSVHQMREVEHLPPHFIRVCFALGTQSKNITDWIFENLEGRFYYGDFYSEKSNGSIEVQKIVGFENPGEASLFALVLDTINKYDTEVF